MNRLDSCTVITVTFNSRRVIEAGLEQWRRFPRLIVVDNGSSDSTPECVRQYLAQARLIESPKNIGYARANNIALAEVVSPYALLLNPDCQLSTESLNALIDCADSNPDAALIGPRYVGIDGRVQESCRPFFHRRERSHRAYVEPSGDLCTEFIAGAALLVNVQLLRRIGGFDSWYFLYCEDEDLAWRVRDAGMIVMVAATAVAVHTPMRSSEPSWRVSFRRHYCHTLSKLYLRRVVGYPWPRLVAYATGVLAGSLIALPLRIIGLSRTRALRDMARILAILTAPMQLARAECEPTPTKLLYGRQTRKAAGGRDD
jgi:GT2 family glycosyltransferase